MFTLNHKDMRKLHVGRNCLISQSKLVTEEGILDLPDVMKGSAERVTQ